MNENQLVKTNEIEWIPLPEAGVEGIYVKSLLFDENTKTLADNFTEVRFPSDLSFAQSS